MAVGGVAEVQMVAGDAITDKANSGTSSDQVGKHSQSLTWKPFGKLGDIGERIFSNGIKRGESYVGTKAKGLENSSIESSSYGLPDLTLLLTSSANVVVDLECF